MAPARTVALSADEVTRLDLHGGAKRLGGESGTAEYAENAEKKVGARKDRLGFAAKGAKKKGMVR